MVSLGGSGNGARSGAYFFEDDSDGQQIINSTEHIAPLLPNGVPSPTIHVHLWTGYLSLVEAVLVVAQIVTLVVLSVKHMNDEITGTAATVGTNTSCPAFYVTDQYAAYFCMSHVGLWGVVAIFDRIIQWRHRVLRRKGYLKFYHAMRNVRRIPFMVFSLGNAVELIFISLLYYARVTYQAEVLEKNIYPIDALYIIVGLETIAVLPCLLYYMYHTILFNVAKKQPDVIQDTLVASDSGHSGAVAAVGFRDGEDLDELLERQADMIRYLQQHNTNLGRRILELQTSQAME